jgi:predicted ATPase
MKKKRIVISGSPGSGKTTLIERLRDLKYPIFEEYSRTLIEAAIKEGKNHYFQSNPQEFSEALFSGRKKQFEALEALKIDSPYVFYDRGIHDIYAYLKAINKDSKFWYDRVTQFQYDLVFLLAPWKKIYITDHQRVETFDEAKHYYSFIKYIYSQSHQIIQVPEGKIESRINFIKDKLNSYE